MENLRCEHQINPSAIESPTPLLGWNFRAGTEPAAVQVQVARDAAALAAGDLLWNSGWVEPATVSMRYRGLALASYETAAWRVRPRLGDGSVAGWSETAFWRMGVLHEADWRASWIGYGEPLPEARADGPSVRQLALRESKWLWAVGAEGDVQPRLQPAQRPGTRYAFSKTFACGENIDWAVLRLAIDGIETLVRLNGELVDLLTCSGNGGADSWALPVDLDLEPFLRPGANTLEISIHQPREHEGYGFQASLAIRENGEVRRILTDGSWSARHVRTGEPRDLKTTQPLWWVPRQVARLRDNRWGQERTTPQLRKTFRIEKPVRSAVVSFCGLGFGELALDGRRVGDRRLDPAFTNYNKRVLYATQDIAASLAPGAHTLNMLLGNGWYNQCNYEIFDFDQASWRDEPKAIVQLRIDYEDGTTGWIVSDESWQAARSPIVRDGIRNGEAYDARLETPGAWHPARPATAPAGKPVAAQLPPERVVEELRADEIIENPTSFIYKFPRNISGWPRLRVRGPAGTRVSMRCFESFDNRLQGWTHQGPYQTDTYILKGGKEEYYEPRFAYHGFQYVELIGYPGQPDASSLAAAVVHTDFDRVGTFRCSSDLLNRVQAATCNSYLGNFHGFPTDCPTREKAGWTADAYLAAETGLMNFDVGTAFSKWIDDLLDCQHEDGRIPDIAPTDTWGYNGFFDWDCVIVYMPWQLFLYSGDMEPLARAFEAMKRFYGFYWDKARDGILDNGRGDWCPETSVTPKAVTTTAMLSDCASLISRVAFLLGDGEAAALHADRAEAAKAAFRRQFLKPDGTVANGTQTAQACALHFNLVPGELHGAVLERLVEAIHAANDHLDAGIFGAKYLFRVLSNNGHHDLACMIALQETFPGYGWWMRKGFTTLPESWSCERSHNHIMFGDISAWFYAHLCGIQPMEEHPGFKRFKLAPKPCAALGHAEAECQCPYGTIRSAWKKSGRRVAFTFEVPPLTEAELRLPDGTETILIPGIHCLGKDLS